MSEGANTNAVDGISDATLLALRQSGKEVLRSPQRLLSYLIDEAPESRPLTVLERNLDEDLLGPLASVVCGDEPPTMNGIRLAAQRMQDLLVSERAVAPQPAHQAIDELCRGVIRYLAERAGTGTRPAQEPGRSAPAPAPKPVAAPTAPTPAHPHTVVVTPSTQGETPKSSESHPVVLPAVSKAPAPGDTSHGTRSPSPRTGTMPVDAFPNTQGGKTPDQRTGNTPTAQTDQIVAPVQPPKQRRYKLVLAIAGTLAAVGIIVGVITSSSRVTVSFDGGGATGSTKAVKTWRDSEVSLPSNGYRLSGYSFAGWELNGKTYQPGDTIKPSDSVTLQAVWAAEINFNGNGAESGSVDRILALPGETITLPELDFARSGYHPLGWDDGGELHAAGDEVTVDGPITYNVSWGPRVSFDGNGAEEGSVEDILAKPGETITLPKVGFKRGKHRANGWEANGKLYKAGDEVTVDSPVTYSVDWGARVTFDGNGADGGETGKLYADSSDKVKAPECGFTYADHIFDGWSKSNTGTGSYSPGDSITVTEPVTYYATWRLDPNIVDKLAVEQVTRYADNGTCCIFLFVTNNSNTTLDITGTIDFKSSSGADIETTNDTSYSVAPGQRTLIYNARDGAAGGDGATTYSISADESPSSRGPLGSAIEVEELSVTSDSNVVRLHNRTGQRVYLGSAACYGTADNGSWAVAGPAINQELDPDESVDVTFEYSFGGLYRQYFINGYTEP